LPISNLIARIRKRLRDLLHHEDPPHRIALGLGLGMFVGLLPIMGIQMAVVALLALPLRANVKAAVATVWISNPLTFIPLYWVNYRFGLLFFPARRLSSAEFTGALTKASDWQWSALKESLSNLMGLGADLMVPLWVGSAVLGVVFGVLAYVVAFRWVVFYRKRIRHGQ